MKNYKKPVSCNLSGAGTGFVPFVAGAVVGGVAKAAGAALALKAATAVSKAFSDDYSLGFKPMDASPVKLGVV